MIELLEEDLRFAPNAFDWRGSTEVSHLIEWLERHGRRVPQDLIALWAWTGGGDMFETEEVLCPTATGDHDLEAVNLRLWFSGLAEELLVFHSGLYLTAVGPDETVVRIDPDRLEPVGFFGSIGDWYDDLRGEYARTYGLPSGLRS